MQVRLNMPWGQWSKGHVFTDMPGGQARTLIDRKIAEEVVAGEPRLFEAPANRMLTAGSGYNSKKARRQ